MSKQEEDFKDLIHRIEHLLGSVNLRIDYYNREVEEYVRAYGSEDLGDYNIGQIAALESIQGSLEDILEHPTSGVESVTREELLQRGHNLAIKNDYESWWALYEEFVDKKKNSKDSYEREHPYDGALLEIEISSLIWLLEGKSSDEI